MAQRLSVDFKLEVHLFPMQLIVGTFNRNPAAVHCLIAILSDTLICYALALACEMLRVGLGIVRNMCTKSLLNENTAASGAQFEGLQQWRG